MTFKTLSAIAVITTALSSPVFAQDMSTDAAAPQRPAHTMRHFRNAYNQAPGYYANQRAGEDFFTEAYGYDRSRIGDRDPDFNPSGN
jgi:hypothetical protein